jgi:hypothetical protein
MYQTVNLHQFRQSFKEIRPNNFSYEGLEVLFNHFEQLEQDTNEKIEFDVIAICCDYIEEDFQEIDCIDDISDKTIGMDESETAKKVAENLSEKTSVIGITPQNTIIYCCNF